MVIFFQIPDLGDGLGPNFILSDNFGATNPFQFTRDELLAGVVIDVNSLATDIFVTSTGAYCKDCCNPQFTKKYPIVFVIIPTTTTTTTIAPSTTTSTSTSTSTTSTTTISSTTSTTTSNVTSTSTTTVASSTTTSTSSTTTSTSSSTTTTTTINPTTTSTSSTTSTTTSQPTTTTTSTSSTTTSTTTIQPTGLFKFQNLTSGGSVAVLSLGGSPPGFPNGYAISSGSLPVGPGQEIVGTHAQINIGANMSVWTSEAGSIKFYKNGVQVFCTNTPPGPGNSINSIVNSTLYLQTDDLVIIYSNDSC